ncbi:MAG: DNA polymerase III subunit alpha [Bacteroidales bacterium]|nr:DNA polymerase III subunit alpha [Bacteroidales bacterium]
METMTSVDTMDSSHDIAGALPGGKGGGYKRPNLTELHQKLFGETFDEAHNATADVEATARCFLELVRPRSSIASTDAIRFSPEQVRNFLENNPDTVQPAGVSVKARSKGATGQPGVAEQVATDSGQGAAAGIPYSHLHVHTQYSILDGAAKIKSLARKAALDGMHALAITDHGNMFGVKDFHQTILDQNKAVEKAWKTDPATLRQKIAELKIELSNAPTSGKKDDIKEEIGKTGDNLKELLVLQKASTLKPVIGSEFYVAPRSMYKKEDKRDGKGHHLILLAKNITGYHNLLKMSSLAYLDGFYYHPRIDKELLKKHREGLIAMSACLGGELAQTIMNQGEEAARNVVEEFKELFGDDYYLEMQRHPTSDERTKNVYEDQTFVNSILKKFSEEYQVKTIATNDVHFVDTKDAPAHDRLICISTNKDVDDEKRMRYTQQEWMKTQDEMRALFSDVPEALENIQEVVDKVEVFELNSNPVMPEFVLPEEFDDHNEYLRHVTYQGAAMRWGEELTQEIRERIDFELATIRKMGFPSYFLIVWDFLKAARELDVAVGPGRGSAAGSAVAYALRITEIDPIKYDLLFERFLNPERVSMPDIDIDFDDDGRARILDWVVKKYGDKRVAHIITFGSMAAKSAIRDVARVQRLPLPEADRLAKMVPERPGMTLDKAYKDSPELTNELAAGTPEVKSVLQYAKTLEGSVRNIGTHACGIIIGRDDLENFVPITTTKDSELTYVTQYDGNFVENIGLLKMDFLGLKTLSIIKDAIQNIKRSKDVEVDIENIPLDDTKTYELYSRGETTGLFQFESPGMKKHLKDLKPERFEDLIAMNALYRPGPMEYIPSFIRRKHGDRRNRLRHPRNERVPGGDLRHYSVSGAGDAPGTQAGRL